jgi:predicted DNA binding CopG/RHH family protein
MRNAKKGNCMPSTKKVRVPKIPQGWNEAKNEAEEAAWWDANSERLMLEAAQRGTLRMGTVEQLLGEMKKAKRKGTRLLSLRVPVADIELAKAQAEEKGMGYQTYIKSRLHESLRYESRLQALTQLKQDLEKEIQRLSSEGDRDRKKKPRRAAAALLPWAVATKRRSVAPGKSRKHKLA